MTEIPFAIALVAGMLAAVNPCGFVMLPAYLSLVVTSEASAAGATPSHGRVTRVGLLGRALATTTAMTAGFVVVFAGFGLVVTPLALSVERHLPWATVVIGAGLAGLGGWLLAGREVTLLTPRLRPGQPSTTLRWASLYGVSYAVASLSCTIAPFLALTSAALRSGSVASGVLVFVAYAAGMGLVVGVLGIGAALASNTFATRIRRALPHINRAGGALLLVVGGYVAYYGAYEIRVLAGSSATDPVVDAATRVQGALAGWLATLGVVPLAGVFMLVVAAGWVLKLRRARHESRQARQAGQAGHHARPRH